MGYTVKVSNVSLKSTERDIYDFFAFSGEISSIQTQPSPDIPGTQVAYVTFHEERSLETALLLTGAVISDRPVTVELAQGYVVPASSAAESYAAAGGGSSQGTGDSLKKAEGIMASLLANGYILGKDAVERARALDHQHELSSRAKLQAETLSRSAADLDQKYSISKKLTETAGSVSRSWTNVDQKYGVTTKTKEALTAAEASLADAGQYMMQNKYVSSGTSWLMGALGQLKTIATDVQQQTAEKVSKAEEERMLRSRAHASSIVDEDEEDRGTQGGPGAKPAQSLGLGDHGPPVAAAAPSPSPEAPTALLSDPPAASPSPTPALAPAAKAASADPPVF